MQARMWNLVERKDGIVGEAEGAGSLDAREHSRRGKRAASRSGCCGNRGRSLETPLSCRSGWVCGCVVL